jgi:hypothetical protein
MLASRGQPLKQRRVRFHPCKRQPARNVRSDARRVGGQTPSSERHTAETITLDEYREHVRHRRSARAR